MKLDLKELLAKITGQSEFKTLLWTNPSPTSQFAPQTISIDLSDYNEVEIEFKHASVSDSYLYQKARVGSADVGLFYMSVKSGASPEYEGRPLTVASDGITFEAGARYYGSTMYTDNIRCIPTRIYGLK